MDIRSMLAANNSKLLEVYQENLSATTELQRTLLREVFQHVVDELGLERGEDATNCARLWLEDTTAMFHFYRRHKFTRSFAMESIRQNLVWRINNIYSRTGGPMLGLLHCLPSEVKDPFGRPIIVLNVSKLAEENGKEELKNMLMPTIDRLQAHLKELNNSDKQEHPVLQYVILLDLAGVSMQSMDINLITWAMREVIPRFPGMIAAVFMLNYSWTHQGLWTVAKRVLPASALSRILFPSRGELEAFFTASSLPREYGGSLPSLNDLNDPIQPKVNHAAAGSGGPSQSPLPVSHSLPSFANTPYTPPQTPPYGYPPSYANAHTLPNSLSRHRRTRDLLRTLAIMWWDRWKVHANILLWSVLAIVAVRYCVKRGLKVSQVLMVWNKLRTTR